MSNPFRSADEMIRSVVSADADVKVAACSVAVEQKTKLIVQIAIGAIAFLIILAIGIDPYFVVIPITLVELGFGVYIGLLGGSDAIVLQKGENVSNWGRTYVLEGVSYDEHTQGFSYDKVHELRMSSIERKWVPSPFGGFKFKHGDTTFTLISTLSGRKKNIYENGRASLKEIRNTLFP